MSSDIIVSWIGYIDPLKARTAKINRFNINGYILDLYYSKKQIDAIKKITIEIKYILENKLYSKIPELLKSNKATNILAIMNSVFNDEFRLYIRYCCETLDKNNIKFSEKKVYKILTKGNLDDEYSSFSRYLIKNKGHEFLKTIFDEIDLYKNKSYYNLGLILKNLDHKAFISYHEVFNINKISETILSQFREEFKVFIKKLARDYTNEREIISYNDFLYYLRTGKIKILKNSSKGFYNMTYEEEILRDIEEVVKLEYDYQLKLYLNTKVDK